jgi:hypothetical protein
MRLAILSALVAPTAALRKSGMDHVKVYFRDEQTQATEPCTTCGRCANNEIVALREALNAALPVASGCKGSPSDCICIYTIVGRISDYRSLGGMRPVNLEVPAFSRRLSSAVHDTCREKLHEVRVAVVQIVATTTSVSFQCASRFQETAQYACAKQS